MSFLQPCGEYYERAIKVFVSQTMSDQLESFVRGKRWQLIGDKSAGERKSRWHDISWNRFDAILAPRLRSTVSRRLQRRRRYQNKRETRRPL